MQIETFLLFTGIAAFLLYIAEIGIRPFYGLIGSVFIFFVGLIMLIQPLYITNGMLEEKIGTEILTGNTTNINYTIDKTYTYAELEDTDPIPSHTTIGLIFSLLGLVGLYTYASEMRNQ